MKKQIQYFLFIIVSTLLFVLVVVSSFNTSQLFFKSEKRVFGATFMTMNNNFFKVIESEIKNNIEMNNDVLITLDPALNIEKQAEQIDYLIKQDVDVIFVNPIDYNAILPSLKKAKEAGIYIIVLDAPVTDESYIDVTIVSDNYQAGVLCAKDLMNKRDSAKILVLEHNSAMSAVDRVNGFKDTISKNSNYQIISTKECKGQIEYAFPITNEVLNNHPEIDTVFALNDPSAIGALAAIEKNNIKDCLVYGIDGTPNCKDLISNNKGMTATVAQFPIEMAKEAANLAYKLLSGEECEKNIIYPVKLIDKNNVDEFDIGGWQ